PFITEEIYTALPHTSESIMISSYPKYDEGLAFPKDEADFSKIMDVIKKVRVMRGDMNVPPSKKTKMYIESTYSAVFEKGADFIKRLASAEEVITGTSFDISGAVQVVTDSARVLIPMAELVDTEKERARLNKELEAVEKDIAVLKGRLENEQFTSKAPAKIIEQEREKLGKAADKKANIEQSLSNLK
ncbi:MAG: class I tRNA ligase family protein, partial [Ruminococcaceae bacterium]|nr:class I tRNA ligase family protein [Oscillospiraceae bacterium]